MLWEDFWRGQSALRFGDSVARSVDADVFVPNGGISADVAGEQVDAFCGVEVDNFSAVFAKPVDAAVEVDGLADDYDGDAELSDESAAIPTGRQRGDHDFIAIGPLPSGMAKGVGFSVDGRIVLLDAAVVPAPQQVSVTIEKGGADGNAAFGEAVARFVDGDLQHLLVVSRIPFTVIRHLCNDAGDRN